MLTFNRVTLDNGLTVIGEVNTDARSLALGFASRTGSRDETGPEAGVSHFLEHMMFKGTGRRTYMDVNREFDEMGAKYNAGTSEEYTVYYAAVLPEHLDEVMDLWSDMLRPAMRQEDFDAEKKVILEEIALYDDQPRWVAYEKAMQLHFGRHPLANSVLGTNESITALTREQMLDYFGRRYAPNNVVLACTGNFDWDRLLELAAQKCGDWTSADAPRDVPAAMGSGQTHVVTRDSVTRQHVVLAADAPSAEDPQRFAAELLATIVGDDAGSRLFWELVDPGLADAADMEYFEHNGAGLYMTYLSCDPEACQEVLEKTVKVFEEADADCVTDEELARAKSKIGSGLVLRSERPMGRLMPLAFNWQYRHEYVTLEDELARIDAVTVPDIKRVLQRYRLSLFTTVGVGPLTVLPGLKS